MYVDCKRLFDEEYALLPKPAPLSMVASYYIKKVTDLFLDRLPSLAVPHAERLPSSLTRPERIAKSIAIAREIFRTPLLDRAARAANNVAVDLGQENSKIYTAFCQTLASHEKLATTFFNSTQIPHDHMEPIVSGIPEHIPYRTDKAVDVEADIQSIAKWPFGAQMGLASHPEMAKAILKALQSPTKPAQFPMGKEVPTWSRLSLKAMQILRVVEEVFPKQFPTVELTLKNLKKGQEDFARPESIMRQSWAWAGEKYGPADEEARASRHALVTTVKEVALGAAHK
jgi:hypothetical protein